MTFPVITGMTFQDFFTDVACRGDKKKGIAWAMRHGLLASEMRCAFCKKMMKQRRMSRSIEGIRWRCVSNDCRRIVNIRKGSFFETSLVTIENLMTIIFLWSYDLPQWQVAEHAEVSYTSIVHWLQRIRDMCSWDLTYNHQKVGGLGHVVAIGETLIAKKSTENTQGQTAPDEWIFGGVDLTTNDIFLELVQDREAASVFPIIVRNIASGSTIWSDQKYASISDLGYGHQSVGSSKNCENAVPGSEVVEARLNACKELFKRKCGVARDYLSSHLDEYVWRCKRERAAMFNDMVSVIRMRYPVWIKCDPEDIDKVENSVNTDKV